MLLFRSLINYEAKNKDELSFQVGEIMEVVDSYVSPNVSGNYMWKAKKEKPDGNLVHGLIPKFRYLNLVFIQLEDMH